MAIARALVHMPKLLIMDEATSQLDTVTEFALHKNLDRFGITRIVIAHRLTTIMDADKIIVLEQGTIKEQGRHDELLKQDGVYKKMWMNKEEIEKEMIVSGDVS